MNCPKCGSDVAEGNFCSVCGHKFNSEDEQELPNMESGNKIKDFFKTLDMKKTIIIVVSAMLIAGFTAFGIMQFNQYQKDIAPLDIAYDKFGSYGKVDMNLRYNSNYKRAVLTIVLDEILGESWMNEYLSDYRQTYPNVPPVEISIPKNNYTKELKIGYNGTKILTDKPIIITFYIEDVNSKEFVLIKDNFLNAKQNKGFLLTMLIIFNKDKKVQFAGKQKWEKEKEEKIRQIELAEAEKNNCIYKTSNGVCFKTKAFYPKPLNYYDCSGGLTTYNKEVPAISKYKQMGINSCTHKYDYWAGAVVQCQDWGYKLSNKYELSSLAHDIYGAIIDNEPRIETHLPDGHSLNIKIMETLDMVKAPRSYWENKDTNGKNGTRGFYDTVTNRYEGAYNYDRNEKALCVFNPNGVAIKDYNNYENELAEEKIKEIEETAKKIRLEREERQKKENEHIENILF